MQKLQEYFSQLSKRDRGLLFVSVALFSFVIFKLMIIDGLAAQSHKLKSRAELVHTQAALMQSVDLGDNGQSAVGMAANQVISNFLTQNNIPEKLKQIRTTSKGEQRFELEDIEFTHLLELLGALDKNGSSYTSLQIKQRKTPGVVNTVLILKN